MSDKTPAASGDSERQSDAPQDSELGPEVGADDAVAHVGGRRRRTQAPVRRGATTVDPEATDETIAELEGSFTPEEQAAAARGVRRSANAPVKKTTATRKRSESQKAEYDPYTAKTPAAFVRQSASEISKVVWPTGSQLTVLFLSVLVFVLFMIAFVGALDLLFGWGLLATLGDS